ncbi:T9SS type A sorting domain-containing protein [Flavobacterium sp. RHBU_24]|uniref:T9SS type A sorting domain-containing protein n=1 Tax=Flavobacterium sp. RHBU_24 TaxID=3391185 RepID=UPI0039851AD5
MQMQQFNKRVTILALMCFYISVAQTTILDQTLLTEQSFNTFTPVSVTGIQTWNHNTTYGAVCSGYSSGQSYENDDFFISPAMDLSEMDNVQLTFSHTRGPQSLMNAGVSQGWYTALATANYTGNPATTQWTELTGLNQDITTPWQYISSGSLAIPEGVQSANTRIAFRYKSSDSQSATWEIKNVKVTGEPQGNPSNMVFKITNWNTEWLGCTEFGPADEQQQIENVAAAMLLMNSDVYCIQEVSNTTSYPSIATLVSLLGSNEWGGTIVPSSTGNCNQRQGLIYKKSTVQFVSSQQLNEGNDAQGGSYHYNWSNGRYPSVYNVNLLAGNNVIPVSLINIHSKSGDDDADSYTRRLGGSQALKTILDGAAYNTKKFILIGDYNDYLNGTSSDACNCTDSPYKNFMDDANRYTPLTQNLTSTGWEPHPIIEHVIISNELTGNYVANSAVRELSLPQNIDDYYNTTTDHIPVSTWFQFPTLSSPSYTTNTVTVYPNPVKDVLTITGNGMAANTGTEIYDLAGRRIFYEKLSGNTLNVSALPSGIYMVKIGGGSAKFVKE